MDITTLHPGIAAETTRLIRSNPRSIFCRGIFIPACELGDDEIPWTNVDPECCFAAIDRDELLGVAGTIFNEDALELFLLEAKRGPRFVEIAERLLHSVRDLAVQRGVTTLKLTPRQPISSAFDMMDDDWIDLLFAMGYYNEIIIGAEMRLDLEGYRIPENIAQREEALAGQGVTVRPCAVDDIAALEEFYERAPYVGTWPQLVRDVIEQVDVTYVMLALKDDVVIAYSTFFARTIETALPEYGPVLIDPDWRRRGLSSVLMARSLMQIVELDRAAQVQLSCYPSKFPVYPRQGFRFTRKYLLHATAEL
ncbi:MAG TPA: hypothetical protein DIT01_05125 [Lentisphaeria bacterium]|nr:hypothetical protein [Lentisphaeria bacterium]